MNEKFSMMKNLKDYSQISQSVLMRTTIGDFFKAIGRIDRGSEELLAMCLEKISRSQFNSDNDKMFIYDMCPVKYTTVGEMLIIASNLMASQDKENIDTGVRIFECLLVAPMLCLNPKILNIKFKVIKKGW